MEDSTVAVLAGSKRSYQSAMEDDNLTSLQTKLFNDPEYSDLTIKCGEKIWRCHRAILCKRCPFFQAACGGSFREAESREIDLIEDNPDALEAMLLFLYTAQFPKYEKHGRPYLSLACRIAVIADKYFLTTLRGHALKELIAMTKATLAGRFQKENKIAANVDLVRLIWQTELDCFAAAKAVILEELANAVAHISEHAEFQQLLADKKDLSLELIKVLSKKASLVTRPCERKKLPSLKRLRGVQGHSSWPVFRI